MKKIKGLTLILLACGTLGSGAMMTATPTTVEAGAYGASFYLFSYRFYGYPPKNWAVATHNAYYGRPGTLVDVAYLGGGYYMGYYKAWY